MGGDAGLVARSAMDRRREVRVGSNQWTRASKFGRPVETPTIELPDGLVEQARRCAASEGTTMRSLIEDALRREIARRSESAAWAPRADLVFTGQGLTDEAAAMSLAEIREWANER